MRSSVLLAGLIAGVVVAVPAVAQNPASAISTGKTIQLTPYAGYIMFGNFIDGPLGTSLSRAAGPLYGAQLGLTVAPGVEVVGNVAYSDGDLRVGIPFLGGYSIGRTKALLYDGSIQLDLPAARKSGLAISPFVQVGAGAIRWDIDLGNSLLQTHSTNLTANVGAGIDLPLGDAMSVRLMAKDYI